MMGKSPKAYTQFLKEIGKTEGERKWPKLQPERKGIKQASSKGQDSGNSFPSSAFIL